MTDRDEVEISDESARSIVQSVAVALRVKKQIAVEPDSGAILYTLCAHHVLEQIDYPSVRFRFQHQQFQEYFAARFAANALVRLIKSGDATADQAFATSVINKPMWEEPVRMVAEEIRLRTEENGTTKDGMIDSGVRLFRLALRVDPILAGDDKSKMPYPFPFNGMEIRRSPVSLVIVERNGATPLSRRVSLISWSAMAVPHCKAGPRSGSSILLRLPFTGKPLSFGNLL
jgi:hypothetical protein